MQTTPDALVTAVGRRLKIALSACADPYASARLGERLNLSPTEWARVLTGSHGLSLKHVWIAAEFLRVDARWLALGKRSRAAVAAIERLDDVEDRLPSVRIDDEDRDKRFNALRTLPEPAIASGLCRYCGCRSPGEFVDDKRTICDVCVFPPLNMTEDAED